LEKSGKNENSKNVFPSRVVPTTTIGLFWILLMAIGIGITITTTIMFVVW